MGATPGKGAWPNGAVVHRHLPRAKCVKAGDRFGAGSGSDPIVCVRHLVFIPDMAIKRMEHFSIIVDCLVAAVGFFTTLGMTIEAEMPVEGAWVDRLNGLEGVQVDIAKQGSGLRADSICWT